MGYEEDLCPQAEKHFDELLNLPFSLELTDDKVDYMIESVQGAIKRLG